MPDDSCTDACSEAYMDCIRNCFRVLVDCLASARSEEEKTTCRERFARCMAVCKEARELCLRECGE